MAKIDWGVEFSTTRRKTSTHLFQSGRVRVPCTVRKGLQIALPPCPTLRMEKQPPSLSFTCFTATPQRILWCFSISCFVSQDWQSRVEPWFFAKPWRPGLCASSCGVLQVSMVQLPFSLCNLQVFLCVTYECLFISRQQGHLLPVGVLQALHQCVHSPELFFQRVWTLPIVRVGWQGLTCTGGRRFQRDIGMRASESGRVADS